MWSHRLTLGGVTSPRSESTRLAQRYAVVATAVTAVLVYGTALALHHDLGETTVSFVMFAGLFAGTAAFLGAEVGRYRKCPRCGEQQAGGRAGDCGRCGYDVRGRPRFVCEEGHASYDAGICPCGRRLVPWIPPDIGRHVKRSIYLGLAILVALIVTGALLGP